MLNCMNTRPVTEELFHADTQTDGRTDRQTDITMPIFRLRIKNI